MVLILPCGPSAFAGAGCREMTVPHFKVAASGYRTFHVRPLSPPSD